MRLLDLFCGAGGAAMGYHRAGFDEIVGVDIVSQPDYPFHFIRADALESPVDLDAFDLIHASPPCQSYTPMSNRHGSRHPRLIGRTREVIRSRLFVIESVGGAKREMDAPIRLTGEMFGLRVHRPRLFELGGWSIHPPPSVPRQVDAVAVYGKPDGRRLWDRKDGTTLHAWGSVLEGQAALGIDWSDDWHQLREAIPPAYTEHIGRAFLEQVAWSRDGSDVV